MPSAGAILLLLLVVWAVGRPSDASRGLTALMSKNGCGGFAGLVAATGGAGEVYRQKSVYGGGLTIFCPDDKAVAAFRPTFKNLTADGQLALLLYHGVATRFSVKALEAIDGEVETLASDVGGRAGRYNLTICDDGDTVRLSSSLASRSEVRVIKMVVDKAPLAVYLIDAVLLPRELLDGSGAAPSPAPSDEHVDAQCYGWLVLWTAVGIIGLAVGSTIVVLAMC